MDSGYQKTSFKERAYQSYKDEIKNLKAVKALLDEREKDTVEEYREPLSYDERKEVTVLLSWGGPSDGYKVYFDPEGEPILGYYFLADWFEYEELKLTSDELDLVLAVYF